MSEVQQAYLDNLDPEETLGQKGSKVRRGSLDTLLVTLSSNSNPNHSVEILIVL